MKKKPTLREVAELAGVSLGTASKVLNNNKGVHSKTRKKVEDAIRELDYSPNRIARSLKSSVTKIVALLLSDITNPFQMTLAKEVEKVLLENGYDLLISSTQENEKIEKKRLKMLYEQRVDGIILCSTGKVNEEISFLLNNIPIVLVDRPIYSIPVDIVADDNISGMELLVNYLYKLGHQRIGVVHGDLNTIQGKIRYESTLNSFKRNNLILPSNMQIIGGFTYEGGYDAVRQFFSLKKPPTAIISANNNITAGIIKACRYHNIKIPTDVSLVSYGSLEYKWDLIVPSITSVTQSPIEVGRKSAKVMLTRLLNTRDEFKHEFIKPKLVIGDSTIALND